jgi:hypothetical protein
MASTKARKIVYRYNGYTKPDEEEFDEFGEIHRSGARCNVHETRVLKTEWVFTAGWDSLEHPTQTS